MHEKPSTRSPITFHETLEEVASDAYAIAQIGAVPLLLDLLCDMSGMGFAAVARVSEETWTVCAVKDRIGFGLKVADQLPLESTLCVEVKRAGEPIVIEHASRDPRYCNHHTPQVYKIESYISVPIVLPNGHYFGNLCAVDPSPAKAANPAVVSTFQRFAALIACQLASQSIVDRAESVLVADRVAREWRDKVVKELDHILLSPVFAIKESSDELDRKANDVLAVKGLATRIRTHALRVSSVLESLLDFSRPRNAAQLRPRQTGVAVGSSLEDPLSLASGSSPHSERIALESLLMQRVGELNSHLGRYDMYALAVVTWLEAKGVADAPGETLTIHTRGASIARHVRRLAVPEVTIIEFDELNRHLLSVLARREIAAKRQASIPSLREPGQSRIRPNEATRDWYDYVDAPDEELLRFIVGLEQDISAVASLYIRLAGWAGGLSMLPLWRSSSPT